jgi:hypothetical protein
LAASLPHFGLIFKIDPICAMSDCLYDAKQLQDDQDDNDDDQGMNPIAGAESRVDIPAKKTEQPQN